MYAKQLLCEVVASVGMEEEGSSGLGKWDKWRHYIGQGVETFLLALRDLSDIHINLEVNIRWRRVLAQCGVVYLLKVLSEKSNDAEFA